MDLRLYYILVLKSHRNREEVYVFSLLSSNFLHLDFIENFASHLESVSSTSMVNSTSSAINTRSASSLLLT